MNEEKNIRKIREKKIRNKRWLATVAVAIIHAFFFIAFCILIFSHSFSSVSLVRFNAFVFFYMFSRMLNIKHSRMLCFIITKCIPFWSILFLCLFWTFFFIYFFKKIPKMRFLYNSCTKSPFSLHSICKSLTG